MNLEDSIVEKLKLLLEYYPVAFYDLVISARNSKSHVVWNDSANILNSNDAYKIFVDEGNLINPVIIKTIRARVRGKGARLRIIDAGRK